MYQVLKPTILNSHSLWLMESQSKSTAKPQSLRPAPVHCDSISKLPVITSRCKSTCVQPPFLRGQRQGRPDVRALVIALPCPRKKRIFAPDGKKRGEKNRTASASPLLSDSLFLGRYLAPYPQPLLLPLASFLPPLLFRHAGIVPALTVGFAVRIFSVAPP